MDNPPDFMALWDYQDPAASALRFHTLLPEARAAADLQLELELLTQIARTHSLQRQFAEAHQLLDEIEVSVRPLPSGESWQLWTK
jgi:hypothetical protein